MVIDLGKACLLVGQVGETLHRFFGAQASIAHPLQHLENGFRLHDRDPASNLVAAGCKPPWRMRQAASAACMTVFRGTSNAAAARRQSSNSGAAFHSSPCPKPGLMPVLM